MALFYSAAPRLVLMKAAHGVWRLYSLKPYLRFGELDHILLAFPNAPQESGFSESLRLDSQERMDLNPCASCVVPPCIRSLSSIPRRSAAKCISGMVPQESGFSNFLRLGSLERMDRRVLHRSLRAGEEGGGGGGAKDAIGALKAMLQVGPSRKA